MCLEDFQEFFLKRELSVMGFLTGNVTTHRFHLGFAYRPNTCPIAFRASLPALAMKPISELMLIRRIPCRAQQTAIPTSLM